MRLPRWRLCPVSLRALHALVLDGVFTHDGGAIRFHPIGRLTAERLAVLTPRRGVNLVLYYGLQAPRAAWRAALLPSASGRVEATHPDVSEAAKTDGSQAGGREPGRIAGPS